MGDGKQTEWARKVEVVKTDEERQLVFGWLSKVVDEAGDPVVDLQGDIIPISELEKAAYEFMVDSRQADVMHDEHAVGPVIESFVSTPEKRVAMGIENTDKSVGWWVGVKVDAETFAAVKKGELGAFSIGGMAMGVE